MPICRRCNLEHGNKDFYGKLTIGGSRDLIEELCKSLTASQKQLAKAEKAAKYFCLLSVKLANENSILKSSLGMMEDQIAMASDEQPD